MGIRLKKDNTTTTWKAMEKLGSKIIHFLPYHCDYLDYLERCEGNILAEDLYMRSRVSDWLILWREYGLLEGDL